ncbi:hypothetical protein WJX81_000354 [Elliptochloris bilobata]|uniref:protein-serine/threonine phosphatase n=1 Tax=Elliptochloris bilobata TaxID=381761 RepID=A0AAW1SA32_9CHLO
MSPGRSFTLLSSGGRRIPCVILPHGGWPAILATALLDEAAVEGHWSCERVPLPLVPHVLAQGPCLTLGPSLDKEVPRLPGVTAGSGDALSQLHSECLAQARAVVVRWARAAAADPGRLLLVPLRAHEGHMGPARRAMPAFWGYSAVVDAPDMAAALLESARLPLVLDLDETLLAAFAGGQLESRLEAARAARRAARAEAAAATDPALQAAAAERARATEREEALLRDDAALLREFAESDQVTVDGTTISATIEPVTDPAAAGGGGKGGSRPVVRLQGEGAVLTRVSPGRRETSMLLRTRPGWAALRTYLEGLDDQQRPVAARRRFDIYVCTAAEREYALEAWRILDPHARLIPWELRQARIVCVPAGRKKTLAGVLGLAGAPLRPPSLPCSAMPLAVIVDDRLDVWEEGAQAQVLRVSPFAPHRAAAAGGAAALGDPAHRLAQAEELARVQGALTALRARLYYAVNEQLAPALRAMAAGVDLPAILAPALPPVPTVAEMLHEKDLQPLRLPPRAPAAAPASLQPVDPRRAPARRGG